MLVNAYSEPIKVQDIDGFVPLLHALNYKSSVEVIIKMLFEANHKATKVQGNGGSLPLHCTLQKKASD